MGLWLEGLDPEMSTPKWNGRLGLARMKYLHGRWEWEPLDGQWEPDAVGAQCGNELYGTAGMGTP